MKQGSEIVRGLASENPLFVLFVGMCPALAVSTRLLTSLWMSLAILCVLVASTLFSSIVGLFGRGKGARARWLASLFFAACFATCADLLLGFFAPDAHSALGLYVPLLAVNCLVTGRSEMAARGQPVGRALLAALGAGLGLAACFTVIAAAREALGFGTLTLFPVGGFTGTLVIAPLAASPARAVTFACGGFLAAGYLAALAAWIRGRGARRAP
jgi:electron transport complex protein RnfE